jgi:hypothetical protein
MGEVRSQTNLGTRSAPAFLTLLGLVPLLPLALLLLLELLELSSIVCEDIVVDVDAVEL